MNKYIATIYDLDGEQMSAYLIKGYDGITEDEIQQKSMERLNQELHFDFEDTLDLRFEIVDLNEDMYEVIDLRKEQTNE